MGLSVFFVISDVVWSGKIDLSKWCSVDGIVSTDYKVAILAYMKCIDEWQDFLAARPRPEEMGLRSSAPLPVVISAAGELSPFADYFLALEYRPASSVRSNNSLKNSIMDRIILPELYPKSNSQP